MDICRGSYVFEHMGGSTRDLLIKIVGMNVSLVHVWGVPEGSLQPRLPLSVRSYQYTWWILCICISY